MNDTFTVGDAVDAYTNLQRQPPSAFSRALLDDIVDAAQALEDVAMSFQDRVQTHAQRIAPDAESVEDMTEAQQEELQEVTQDLRAEPADVEVPTIDPRKADTIQTMRELRDVDVLQPLFPDR